MFLTQGVTQLTKTTKTLNSKIENSIKDKNQNQKKKTLLSVIQCVDVKCRKINEETNESSTCSQLKELPK